MESMTGETSESVESSSEESFEETTQEAQTDIAELERRVQSLTESLENVQGNYDNSYTAYEEALSYAEDNLSEAKKIAAYHHEVWKTNYDSIVSANANDPGTFTQEEVDEAWELYQKWKGYDEAFLAATLDDVRAQTFPQDFDNVNVAGALLALDQMIDTRCILAQAGASNKAVPVE